MEKVIQKKNKNIVRRRRTRSKVRSVTSRPRLSVFKSNRAIYAQLIDDSRAVTLVSASAKSQDVGGMRTAAKHVGEEIAKKAKAEHIVDVVFDRGAYRYTGVVKELADAARAGGLNF